MGRLRPPEKTFLFVGALFPKDDVYVESYYCLQKALGEVVMETPRMDWNFSDHYQEEMGKPLYKRFLFFRNLMEPDALSDIKHLTNDLEKKLSVGGRRMINLDPGYLTLAKIVLASTKDYSHRLYLKSGIYGEVTLVFSKTEGKYVPNINTYFDYKDERYIRYFLLARELFSLLSKES